MKPIAHAHIYVGRCEYAGCKAFARLEGARLEGVRDAVALLMIIEGQVCERTLSIELAQRWSCTQHLPDGSVWWTTGLPCCIEHRLTLRFTPLRTRRSVSPCDDRCTHATSELCACACGGINHGIDA